MKWQRLGLEIICRERSLIDVYMSTGYDIICYEPTLALALPVGFGAAFSDLLAGFPFEAGLSVALAFEVGFPVALDLDTGFSEVLDAGFLLVAASFELTLAALAARVSDAPASALRF